MIRKRWLVLSLLLGLWIFASAETTLLAFRPVTARPPPPALLEPPGTARLARHVLFVVIDGLRWDVATDPLRMPRLGNAMRQHSSAAILADRVTMTSSAVLAYGTGQRGGLDQVLENLHPPLTGVNDWLSNAKRSGLRIMVAGDRAWAQLYASALTEFLPDPEGVGIDHDFNRRTFDNAKQLQRANPDVLVAHFVTPDHQGHAYGINSTRYARHIFEFDRTLFEWLDALGPDWTIIVTSDHGAADTGTHGTDTVEQRRCPLVAYGPGVVANLHPAQDLDQVAIPGLMSALLGVANAAQSRASIPFAWLDEPSASARRLACREIDRVTSLSNGLEPDAVESVLEQAQGCCHGPVTSTCEDQAVRLAAAYDRHQAAFDGPLSTDRVGWLSAMLLLALAASVVLQGPRVAPVIGFGTVWLALSLGLTYGVERLSGAWPNFSRGALFAIANLTLLILCIGLVRRQVWLGRRSSLVLSILPGWLLVSYTANTQVEAYVVLVLLALVLLVASRSSDSNATLVRSGTSLAKTGAAALFPFAVLALPGTHASDVTPAAFNEMPIAASVVSGVLLALGLLYVLRSLRFADGIRRPLLDVVVRQPLLGVVCGPSKPESRPEEKRGALAAVLSPCCVLLLFGLRYAPLSWVGRLIWVGLMVAAGTALAVRRASLAFVLAVASTVWLARDFECVVLLSSLVVAALVGKRASSLIREHASSSGPRPWNWVHVTFLFALGYLTWIGLQGGLQLNAMDFTAGTFGDSHVAPWFVGACLVYKFVMSQILLLAVFARTMLNEDRDRLARGIISAHLARGVTLLLMLAFCGKSYWTAFRIVADLPFALAGVIGVVIVFAFRSRLRSHAPEPN